MKEEKHTDAAEMRFRAVAQSSNDAIIIGDQAGNILFWNSGAQTIFGYQSEEVVGKPLTLLMPQQYRTPILMCALMCVEYSWSFMGGCSFNPVSLHSLGRDYRTINNILFIYNKILVYNKISL